MHVKAFCSGIELYPRDNLAYESLHSLFTDIKGFEYTFTITDPGVNQGQMISNFDNALEDTILAQGATHHDFELPQEIPQKLDFAFKYKSKIVAVEVEKTNREKILRDILKAHMYIHSGVDFVLLALPKNYPHSGGMWDLYDFGRQRYGECLTYKFGSKKLFDRILLMGLEQFDIKTKKPLDTPWRKQIREMAKKNG